MKKTLLLASVLGALVAGQAFAHDPDAVFNKFDTNKDGKITPKEYAKTGHNNFSAIDTNGDGVITRDEIHAWHDRKMAAKNGDTRDGNAYVENNTRHNGYATQDYRTNGYATTYDRRLYAPTDANPHPTKDR